MAYQKIQVTEPYDGAVLKILLDAPKGNILDGAMMGEILDALDRVTPDTKLVLFCAAGKHFSFGASVEEHVKEKAGDMLEKFHGIFRKLIKLGVPTGCVVQGQCLGGGMELAIFCNFIIASERAVFGQPEIKLAVFPPPASVILPAKVGQARADLWTMIGCNVDARTAEAAGLVLRVVPDEELDGAVASFVEKEILPLSGSSLRMALQAVCGPFHEALTAGLERVERLYLDRLMETEDANEGIGAFMEKRKPVWKNR